MTGNAETNPRELREDLIDTLLALSLLSKRAAQNLVAMGAYLTEAKGDYTDVEDEPTRQRPCRIVCA